MKNYWIKVKGQWRIVGDTGPLKLALQETNNNVTSLETRANAAEGNIAGMQDDITAINNALGISGGGSGNSITQQIQDISDEIAGLKNKDIELGNQNTQQDSSILELKKTLGVVDESGNPTESSVLDELTECCNDAKESITTITTTLTEVKETVDILTDEDNPNSIAKQLDAKASELQSSIDSLTEKSEEHESEITRLETVVGLTEKDGAISSKFDDIAVEQSNQNTRLSALEESVGLGDGSEGSSITQQVKNLRSDVDGIVDTLNNETTGHTKRITDLETENESQESDISDIKDILGITEDEEGNPVSEVLQSAKDCCQETKAAIAKLNDPEDPAGIASQLASVKSELESSIAENTTAIESNTQDIESLKEKDATHEDEIGKLKNALGMGGDDDIEDASLTAQVGSLRSDVADIKADIGNWPDGSTITESISNITSNIGELPENKTVVDLTNDNATAISGINDNIGNWTGDKTITESIESLKDCCTESKERLDQLEDEVGDVPEGKNLYQLTVDNASAIDDINSTMGDLNLGEGVTVGDAINKIKTDIGTVPEGQNLQQQITDISNLVGTVSGEITATHEERLGSLQEQADATDGEVSNIKTDLAGFHTSYDTKIAQLEANDTDYNARITTNTNNIASNDQDIEALQAQDVVLENSKISKSGSRGSLNGFESVNPVSATAAAVPINKDSADTTLITATTKNVNLAFTPGDTNDCSVKVITIKNTIAETVLDTGAGDYMPTWANNNDPPEWGSLANGLLILIAHFIGGEIVLTVFHNSEA